MADTVNIPGMGAQKKTTVYIAGGIGVVIVGVVWYRSRNTATSTTTSTPVDTTQIDPATGYAYGSAEDAAALAAQSSYISAGGSSGGGSSYYSGGQQPTGFVSDAQWAQAAEDYLGNTVGSDLPTVSAALGKYITGGSVTDDQHSIINQAIAFQGYPPVPGPDGYPPSVRTVAATPPTATVQFKDVVELARLTAPTNARLLVQTHSDPKAGPNTIETQLRLTYSDPRNSAYRSYYQSHDGWWPAKAAVYIHAAKLR